MKKSPIPPIAPPEASKPKIQSPAADSLFRATGLDGDDSESVEIRKIVLYTSIGFLAFVLIIIAYLLWVVFHAVENCRPY